MRNPNGMSIEEKEMAAEHLLDLDSAYKRGFTLGKEHKDKRYTGGMASGYEHPEIRAAFRSGYENGWDSE